MQFLQLHMQHVQIMMLHYDVMLTSCCTQWYPWQKAIFRTEEGSGVTYNHLQLCIHYITLYYITYYPYNMFIIIYDIES